MLSPGCTYMAVRSGPLEKSKYMAESMEKVMEKPLKNLLKLQNWCLLSKESHISNGISDGAFYGYFRSAFVSTVGLTT